VQQLYRQLQFVVNEAIRTLDAAQPDDPANHAEVENLRKLVWSELTGLEAEFGREGGPRTDRAERFFTHLLSSGSHVGQIEALGGALLGGQPPPTRPAPDSPVAGLHRLHNMLTELQQQWQQIASPADEQVPTVTRRSDWQAPEAEPEPRAAALNRPAPRKPAPPRAQPRASRRPEESAGLLENLGFRRSGRPLEQWGNDAPRPRVLFSFVVVFIILGIMGIGVIYLGLNSSSDAASGGTPLQTPNTTLTVEPSPSLGASPTATLNPAAPQLQLLVAEPIEVPCPTSTLAPGTFIIRNAGGQMLTWTAHINAIGANKSPVTLDPPSGDLFGAEETNSALVTVSAQVSSGSGTITIMSNGGSRTISYQIIGNC
jgi:hypothetical protein